MSIPEHIVDLDAAPGQRWAFLADHRSEMNELISCYLRDFEGATSLILDAVSLYRESILPAYYQEEIESIAQLTDFSTEEVLIANLYYDILKFYFGCTAFSINNEAVNLHARNLDWHTENNLLSTHTRIFDFQKKGVTVFKTVGWAGFVGALSGIRPQRFSLTLNAVLSNDQPEMAYPVSLLLRDVLCDCNSFATAQEKLEKMTIASDCLLLLTGPNANEQVVIERTPTRFATRMGTAGFVAVTNDYKTLQNNSTTESVLQSTSCGRFDRATLLAQNDQPKNWQDCLQVLQDDEVMMGITVQQMVFNNRTGEIHVVKT